jgi:AcrR family transcriptional regulator
MARKYELKRRAERQEGTRRRIVDAAVELHGSIGPARTTVSDIARRAGVQRHTYYSHFPTERSLAVACSGLYMDQNPLPDPEPWREIPDPEARLRRALRELYDYYADNDAMIANVMRDAEIDPLTHEMFARHSGKRLERMHEILLEGLSGNGRPRKTLRAAVELALSFRTWQTLVRQAGLGRDAAVAMMVAAVRGQ